MADALRYPLTAFGYLSSRFFSFFLISLRRRAVLRPPAMPTRLSPYPYCTVTHRRLCNIESDGEHPDALRSKFVAIHNRESGFSGSRFRSLLFASASETNGALHRPSWLMNQRFSSFFFFSLHPAFPSLRVCLIIWRWQQNGGPN